MSTAVVGVAEIEFTIEERRENCSDVISCGFEDGLCGWSLGDNVLLSDNGKGANKLHFLTYSENVTIIYCM